MTARPQSPHHSWPPVWRWAAMSVACALACALAWKAWQVNVRLACWKGEWPLLALCDQINGRTPEERWSRLQDRLARNPGDAQAKVEAAVLAHSGEVAVPTEERSARLAAAAAAAPQDVNVLLLQARQALEHQRWTEALDHLTPLAQHHRHQAATQTLVALLQAAAGQPLLQQALREAARRNGGWLEPVLRAMPGQKVPVGTAWFVVAEVMSQHRIGPATAQWLMGRLKAEGLWQEAHGVWLHVWQRPTPLLFNGGFDEPFVRAGFDWEVSGPNDHRAGALVELVARPGRGRVMKVRFVGKGFASPVVGQHLVLPAGHYRLQGDWQSAHMRSEQGLVWVLECLGTMGDKPWELARSQALLTSGRDWNSWQIRAQVPPQGCGPGLRLSLQPAAPYEARAGMHGEVVFDAFSLEAHTGDN